MIPPKRTAGGADHSSFDATRQQSVAAVFYENGTRPDSDFAEIALRGYKRGMHVGPHRGDDREKKSYTGLEFPTLERPQNSVGDEPPRPRAWDRWRRAVIRLLEQILFEPQSPAQREQLARKILDYSRMNRKDSEPPLIHVPEMADRFRESRRNVRQSLTLLEENGTVERTQSKDHWKLTIQVHSPARATYDAATGVGPLPEDARQSSSLAGSNSRTERTGQKMRRNSTKS